MFDAQVEAGDVLDNIALEAAMALQRLDRVAAMIVEDEWAFDLDQAQALARRAAC